MNSPGKITDVWIDECSEFTLDQLNAAVALAKKNRVTPSIVCDEAQAKRMTDEDPFGKKWLVGDEYIMIIHQDGSGATFPASELKSPIAGIKGGNLT